MGFLSDSRDNYSLFLPIRAKNSGLSAMIKGVTFEYLRMPSRIVTKTSHFDCDISLFYMSTEKAWVYLSHSFSRQVPLTRRGHDVFYTRCF